ncbi:MAG TPA: choline dehydrogenase, partial [Gammaproteobacteria bacterium]|nr:choline dehydrogenase [Gammaproteobacteria bacterium]
PLHDFSGFTSSVCQLRPSSRGHLEITSADPFAKPAMHPGYLSTEQDQQAIVAALRVARRIAAQPALAHYIVDEYKPGLSLERDDELLEFARDTGVTIFHPSGTCRMGADDDAVVDCTLKVRGVAGLRVVDCSIMPTLVSGNTHAPAVMIAEKASDLILADVGD